MEETKLCKYCNSPNVIHRINMCACCKQKFDIMQKNKPKPLEVSDVRTLLMQFIRAWESPIKTESIFECIYIDACKIVGHDRKKRLKKQIRV